VIKLKTSLKATDQERCNPQRFALHIADSEFTCFSVPVKQLKPNPVREIRTCCRVAGRKEKANDEYLDNLDGSPRRFSFYLFANC